MKSAPAKPENSDLALFVAHGLSPLKGFSAQGQCASRAGAGHAAYAAQQQLDEHQPVLGVLCAVDQAVIGRVFLAGQRCGLHTASAPGANPQHHSSGSSSGVCKTMRCSTHLAVQVTANKHNLVHRHLPLLPRLVCRAITDCLVHTLKHKLLVSVALRGDTRQQTECFQSSHNAQCAD